VREVRELLAKRKRRGLDWWGSESLAIARMREEKRMTVAEWEQLPPWDKYEMLALRRIEATRQEWDSLDDGERTRLLYERVRVEEPR